MLNKLRGLFNSQHGITAEAGYNAANPGLKRKNLGSRVRSADNILTDEKRRRLQVSTRDLQRNFAAAAWAIRHHLDLVSSFNFTCESQDETVNERVEELVEWWSRPLNFDSAARHSRRSFTRLVEMMRVLDGDVFTVKLAKGQLQAIEGDRVKNPVPLDVNQNWTHGIKVGAGGMMKAIAVHQRDRNGNYLFEREVSAANTVQVGYFDAFDQYRGVSPLAAAIELFQDTEEVMDYARAKAKVAQLFALTITREMSDLADESDEEEEEGDAGYKIDMNRGPLVVDMDPGDALAVVESRTPSTEFNAFNQVTLLIALKALDIPYSAYDESFSTYYGSRAGFQQYLISVKSKQEAIQEFLNRVTVWRLNKFIADGVLELPADWTVGDLNFSYVPDGVPWWSPDKDVAADIMAIDAGLKTRTEVRKANFGDSWKDTIRKLKQEEEFMADVGIVPVQPTPIPSEEEDKVPGTTEINDLPNTPPTVN